MLAVADATWKGIWSDPYLQYVEGIPPPHPYPVSVVAWVIGLVTMHALLMFVMLRPATYQRSWGRALSAFVLTLPFLATSVMGAMHAPPPLATYFLWCLAWTVAMLGMGLWLGFTALFKKPARHQVPEAPSTLPP